MVKVAILMATYNGAKFVSKQMASIFEQQDVEVHLFINDDCSTDDTLQIIEMEANCNDRVQIIGRTEKYGSASANFFALVENTDVSNFDYVAFADQDDIWFKDKISFAIKALDENKCGGFSSSITAYWPSTNKEKLIVKSTPQTSEDYWFESPGPGCSQVFTKASFLHFQLFVRANYEELKMVDYHDWLVYAYYRFQNLGWHISPVSKMLYVQHGANQIGANNGVWSLVRRFRMVRKKWLRGQVNLIHQLVSGKSEDLVKARYMFKNCFRVRRMVSHSVALCALFFLGLM